MIQFSTMSYSYCVKCGKPLGSIYYTIDDQPWCTECCSYCVKCGKPLGSIYYTIDDQPWCTECFVKSQQLPTGWVCPRCGRVNAQHVNQCSCV